MILHTIDRFGLMAHSFDCLIVQIDSVDLQFGGQGIGVNSKPVVLRSDFNATGLQILNRLIAAAMAEFELEGLSPESLAEDLVSQADADNWNVALDQIAHGSDCGP